MHPKIKNLKEIIRISTDLKKSNKKVVFCHGFFDILHMGHVTFLKDAKSRGDILIVGVDCDKNARVLKGPTRPINDQKSRMFVLANLETVDFVFLIPPFNEADPDFYFQDLYERISPWAVASSLKAGKHGKYKLAWANKVGIKFIDISNFIYGKSTSVVAKILGLE